MKNGVQFALDSLNYEISVRTLFPDMDSIYNWNFTTNDLQSIKVMDDPHYFEDRTQRTGVKNFTANSVNQSQASSTGTYAAFMTELYSKFDKSIDDNPQTQRNFDGIVDEAVIRDRCMGFKKSIEAKALAYSLKSTRLKTI